MEWNRLKSYPIPILKSQSKVDYLEVWKGIFKNKGVVRECTNMLHVVKILLITPFANAKLERVFSQMNQIKIDSRTRLGLERIDTQMCISKEGQALWNLSQTLLFRIGTKIKFAILWCKTKKIPIKMSKICFFQQSHSYGYCFGNSIRCRKQ